jgi:hypothetical protein
MVGGLMLLVLIAMMETPLTEMVAPIYEQQKLGGYEMEELQA